MDVCVQEATTRFALLVRSFKPPAWLHLHSMDLRQADHGR